MKVADMPDDVRDAVLARGYSPEHDMTPENAVAEWSAWHLGDRYWGCEAVRLYKAMAK
jgi:hypothetical protein